MSETRRVARRYFDAWTSGDGDTVAGLLAPDSPSSRATCGSTDARGGERP